MRILLVEDEPDLAATLRKSLAESGFSVDVTADGGEALWQTEGTAYDVIVLDLMMPNLDGFTFINQLSDSQPDRLRSVIVTSAASPAVIRQRMKGQAFRVLPKPFDIHELVAAVRSCIAQS